MRLRHALTAIAALGAVHAVPATAATTIDLDGTANASLDGSTAVTLALAAGTYTLQFIDGTYTAYSRFSSPTGCDLDGKNCTQGWENSARISIDGGSPLLFGDGNASGGFGPIDPGDGYYSTAALSFANSGIFTTNFTLATDSNVSFFLYDDILSDNQGGVSLQLSAVPEPATWALMILGFGLVGGVMRRRSTETRMRFV